MRSKASSLAATVLSYEQESGAIATGPVNTAVRISHDEAGALAADTCCSSMFKADRSSGASTGLIDTVYRKGVVKEPSFLA